MYRKVILHKDERHFGNEIAVFKSEAGYFIVIRDRGELSYFVSDSKLMHLYPINEYMKKVEYGNDFDFERDELDLNVNLDLDKIGCSPCPEWLKDIIGGHLK